MTRKQICTLIVQSIKDYLSTPSRLEAFKAPHRFVRNRLLSMLHVIMYLLFSDSPSMDTNLSNIKRELQDFVDFPKKITKQAVSHARQAISPLLFSEIFNLSVDLFYKNFRKRSSWHGLHVFAIDGSKFELPNSSKNFEYFGELFSAFDHNRKYTQALASIVYDVLDDYIVHASINRYLASERDAAVTHMKNLEELDIYKDSVIVFDRGYYSEAMFRYCSGHEHYCVMRLKENLKFSLAAGKKTTDFQTVLQGNEKEGTKDIPVRIISVKLDSGEYEYLATNIFDKTFAPSMFRELYFLRWPVEQKYLELKERIRIEDFNGATPVSIMQEFYIKLLLSNLASLIKNDADKEIEANRNPANKHRYQSNRSFVIGQLKLLLPKMVFGLVGLDAIDSIYFDACNTRSQIQPGRKAPRKAKKDNLRTHFRNRKPAF